MQDFYKKLREYGQVKLNEPLSKHTSFRIGGPADILVIVEDSAKIGELLKFLDGVGQSYFALGGGSNILVGDEGIRGVVVKMKNRRIVVSQQIVEADAGATLVEVAQKSIQAGLTGFEWGVGVPGSVGGAVRGNAGSMGREMKDGVVWVEAYKDGEIVRLTNEECQFGYRDSIFKHCDAVVIRAGIGLELSSEKDGMKKVMNNIKYRGDTQPKGFFCAGCVFKNYPTSLRYAGQVESSGVRIPDEFIRNGKIPAGWLIERAGMKGTKIGNAQVSDKHGNFIVNLGGATAREVLDLIAVVKEKVYNKFGIELKEEIQIIQ